MYTYQVAGIQTLLSYLVSYSLVQLCKRSHKTRYTSGDDMAAAALIGAEVAGT